MHLFTLTYLMTFMVSCFWPLCVGTGVVSARGGAGACVPHCHLCDQERRCLQCQDGYFWVGYNCVPSCQNRGNQCCDRNRFVATCAANATSSAAQCYSAQSNCYRSWWYSWYWYYCGPTGRYCYSETNPTKMVGENFWNLFGIVTVVLIGHPYTSEY